MEPIFEREFAEHSYGFRPGRSCKHALARVEDLLKQGYTWVVDADLQSYFDQIPHSKLMQRVRERVADGRVLQLIEAFLKAHILEGLESWEPDSGTPQGAVISPLLSNIYLNPLDQLLSQRGFAMVRYADDFVVLCRSQEEAQAALAEIQQWTAEAGLRLHPEKTRIVSVGDGPPWLVEGFDFLGFRFTRDRKIPRAKSLKKFKDTIRMKTQRRNGCCMQAIVSTLNPNLRGWFNYFRASERYIFRTLDQMIRRRVRAILVKRAKQKGHGRGKANYRWPNAYFKKYRLLSLLELRDEYCQSLRGTR
jgi:RNA-directed DNA polymerase